MKNVIALLLAFFMTFSFIGCGRISDNGDTNKKRSENVSGKENGVKGNDGKDKSNEKEDKKGTDRNSEDYPAVISKANTNLTNEDKIPDGYPMELVPFPAGAEIYSGTERDLWGMPCYLVTAITEDNFKDVLSFYKEVFKNSGLFGNTLSDGSYMIQGEYEKMNLILTIKEEKKDSTFDPKYKTSIETYVALLKDETLGQLQEAEGNNNHSNEGYTMEEFYPEEDPNKQSNSTGDDIFTGGNANAIESVNTTLTGEPIPKGFDTDLVPVPSGSVISFTSSFEDGGNKIYAVSGSSKYKPNDLVAFYMKLLKDVEKLQGESVMYSYLIEATLNDVYISIYIYEDNYDDYKSGFEISMDLSN